VHLHLCSKLPIRGAAASLFATEHALYGFNLGATFEEPAEFLEASYTRSQQGSEDLYRPAHHRVFFSRDRHQV
jgi:hypothetical protein